MPRGFTERFDQLVATLRAGNQLEVAARAAGFRLEMVERWLQRGGEAADRIRQAMAEGEVRSVTRIAQAATDNWQAAAWLLERQYPERWGRVGVRPADDLSAPVVATDGVDELAGRRATRRAGLA